VDKVPVIVAAGLTRTFGDLTAVDHLNLEVAEGEVLGFLGHNGAGKTTTVRLLNGVLTATAGTARVLGLDPAEAGAALRRRTGVLTETPAVDERLTGHENLAIFAALYDVPKDQVAGRVDELLGLFELSDRAADRVSEYSKGMKQRLALARAMLHRPELLFLDEPTAGLDPVSTRHVHTMIRDLSRNGGHTVFLCTHNLEEAQRLCDRVAVLEHGRLMALGTPAELARSLHQGVRLEIETVPEAVAPGLAVLQAFPDARDVSQLEAAPVLTVALSARDAIPAMISRMVAADVPLYRVTPQEATLEDVYFALHEREEASR
jgi:ABC-2 type transport system ATP-binding protein